MQKGKDGVGVFCSEQHLKEGCGVNVFPSVGLWASEALAALESIGRMNPALQCYWYFCSQRLEQWVAILSLVPMLLLLLSRFSRVHLCATP